MILDDIVAQKRYDVAVERVLYPIEKLEQKAQTARTVRDFCGALSRKGLSVIAEVKRASPSKGDIVQDIDSVRIALQYQVSGASAVSVLTEKKYFKGRNRDLEEVSENIDLPVLRKDFMIDAHQVVQARALGADAILLIAAILDDITLKKLFDLATAYGLHCLFEAHNKKEVKRVVDCGARIVGINNRNLKTMEIELSTFETLRGDIPDGIVVVAESGILCKEDAMRMKQAGADAILVGEALMRSSNLRALMKELAGG